MISNDQQQRIITENHNSGLIGLNDPLNYILKTPEVLRGALGDISRKSRQGGGGEGGEGGAGAA